MNRTLAPASTTKTVMLPLAVLIAALVGFTDVKIADIQSVELAVIGALMLSMMQQRARLRITGSPVVVSMLPQVIALLTLLLMVSLFSLRLRFYPIPDTGPLKQPPWTTFVRLFEIAVSISAMFIVALGVGTRAENLKKIFAVYVWGAYIGSVYGLVSLAGWLVGLELPGATGGALVPRVRGFFVEGGPFGVFLVSALLIHIIRYVYLGYVSRGSFWIGAVILFAAMLGAQSKSAFILALFMIGAFMFLTRRFKAVFALLLLAIPFILTSGVVNGVSGYIESRERFAVLAFTNPEDYNLVMGRVMASILLPRIIEAHPFLGIGIGNYSLVRNDPSLLRGLPQVDLWDLQSLGLLGYMAELGIPLTLFVMYIYFRPFKQALRTRPWIALLAIYPLGAALFGVQITFTYPWVVMGLALSAIAIHDSNGQPSEPTAPSARPRRGRRRGSSLARGGAS